MPAERLARAEFPRASRYDDAFHFECNMGPNVLWLTEALSEVVTLEPGMRVLDLGCGKAASSIFLAREFDVQVVAADLWIKPGENLERIRGFGLESRVLPISVEAHDIPFAPGYFDAAVAIDSFHYFGTDDLYLAYLARFVQPGGQIGIAVPGVAEEYEGVVPAHLAEWWEPEYHSFHSAGWWRRHWVQSGAVEVAAAEEVPGSPELWLDWTAACVEAGSSPLPGMGERELAMLTADAGRALRLLRVVGRVIED